MSAPSVGGASMAAGKEGSAQRLCGVDVVDPTGLLADSPLTRRYELESGGNEGRLESGEQAYGGGRTPAPYMGSGMYGGECQCRARTTGDEAADTEYGYAGCIGTAGNCANGFVHAGWV